MIDVVKKTMYDKLVIKVNAIGTKIPSIGRLVTKTWYGLGKKGLEKVIEDDDKKVIQYYLVGKEE